MNLTESTFDYDTYKWLNDNQFNRDSKLCKIGGNGRDEIYLIENHNNDKLVVKLTTGSANDIISVEVHGLTLITETNTVDTAKIHSVSDHCIVMDYLYSQGQSANYWQSLGTQLAELHRAPQPLQSGIERPIYGLDRDNYCGKGRQFNHLCVDGHAFFCDYRLLNQARLAYDNGYLESPWIIHIESICERLTDLIPAQPVSLLHGDLWSGNLLINAKGQPALIDPAVYYGWREADIAMTLLFGGFPHDFYSCYHETWPLEPGWRKRVPLYNLYHLLNHLNIFGVSYLEQVQSTISRYA
ncbi:MAG: fructosamine kinase family protein [Pseudomonadales bacterium]|nr:fructosamine kinase family protein [Pseudomonadales bacterium]